MVDPADWLTRSRGLDLAAPVRHWQNGQMDLLLNVGEADGEGDDLSVGVTLFARR